MAGIPKPIQLTFGYFGALDAGAYVPIPKGRFAGVPDRLSKDDVILAAAPFFHLMGFSLLIISVFHGIRCVVAPDKPLSTEFLTSMLHATKPTAILLPPCILEDMTLSQASMEALWNLKYVFWGGSSLSPEIGRKIRKHSPLTGFMGMTEAGFILSLAPEEEEDWEYFEWWPTNGIDMELVDDNLYEMVIHRHDHPFLQPIFHTFPDLNAYHTKDIYTRHPTKPNLWKLRGRLDDVVSLSNGEKFNPVTMEKIIEGHPLVVRAVVVGNGRFQPALLVEPNWNQWNEANSVTDLITSIWPTVQEANRINPAHGRIMKNKIGVASKSKPFQTTPKGSTQRRLVTRDYEKEIDDIYTKLDDGVIENQIPDPTDLSGVKEFVRNVVSHTLGFSSFSDQADFYTLGLDSLQTMHLSRTLQASMCSCRPSTKSKPITAQNIYGNSTVAQLASFVYGITSNTEQSTVSRSEKIDTLVQKYTIDLPKQDAVASEKTDLRTVILTGSTGSLGNYLLNALLNDPTVIKVYCLNRSEARDRQAKSFQEKGFHHDFNQGCVEFLAASFGEERFGISSPKYEEMLSTVDTVIHNAWRMDFNISVDSFEDVHIRGVRHFIDFSLQSTHHAHIHFMSSIGTIGGWKLTHGPSVPETPIEDCDVTLRQGYAEAKHICERICLAASQRAGVLTSILRLGQIAGPTTESGMWNRQEWLPIIVATSKAMGKIPRTLGSMPVEWIPVVSCDKTFML
jgi:nucleoside-diphosphate-sugar epimerase